MDFSNAENTFIELLEDENFANEEKGPLSYLDDFSLIEIATNLFVFFFSSHKFEHKELFPRYVEFVFNYLYTKESNSQFLEFFMNFIDLIKLQEETNTITKNVINTKRYLEFIYTQPEEERKYFWGILAKLSPRITIDEIAYYSEKLQNSKENTHFYFFVGESLKNNVYDEEFYTNLFNITFKYDYSKILFYYFLGMCQSSNGKVIFPRILPKLNLKDYHVLVCISLVSRKAGKWVLDVLIDYLPNIDEDLLFETVIALSMSLTEDELLQKVFIPTKSLNNVKAFYLFTSIVKNKQVINEFINYLWDDNCYSDEFLCNVIYTFDKNDELANIIIAKLLDYDFTKASKYTINFLHYVNYYSNKEYQSTIITFLFEIYKATKAEEIKDYAQSQIIYALNTDLQCHDTFLETAMEKGNETAACNIICEYINQAKMFIDIKPHKSPHKVPMITISYTFQYQDYTISVNNDATVYDFMVLITKKHQCLISKLSCYSGENILSENSLCYNHPIIYVAYTGQKKYLPFIFDDFLDKIIKSKFLNLMHKKMIEDGSYEALKLLNTMKSINCDNPQEMLLQATNSATREYYLQYFITNSDKITESVIAAISRIKSRLTTRNEKKMFYQIVSKSSSFSVNDEVFNDIISLSSKKALRACAKAIITSFTPEKMYNIYETVDQKSLKIIYDALDPSKDNIALVRYFVSKFSSTEKNFIIFCDTISKLLTKESTPIDKLFSITAAKFKEDKSIETKAGCSLIFAKIVEMKELNIDEFLEFANEAINVIFKSSHYDCFLRFLSALMTKTTVFNEQINRIIFREIKYYPKIIGKTSSYKGGLVNNGATCYINAALRALFMIKPAANIILKTRFNDTWKNDLQSIFGLMLYSEVKMIITKYFCSSYTFNKQPIDVMVQEDSIEFLHDVISKLPKEVNDLFTGTIENVFDKAGNKNRVREDFIIQWLEAKENGQIELLLKDISKEEIIFDSKNNIIRKSASFVKLPNYLIVGLRRFNFDATTGKRNKIKSRISINTHISYPDNYTMVATINHIGTTDSGHYTVSVPKGDKWILYSDTAITEVDELDQSLVYCIIYKKDDYNEEDYVPKEDIPKSNLEKIDRLIGANYILESLYSNEMFELIKLLPLKTMLKYYSNIAIYSFEQDEIEDLGQTILNEVVDNDLFDELVLTINQNYVEYTLPLVSSHIRCSQMTDFLISVIATSQSEQMINFVCTALASTDKIMTFGRFNDFCKIINAVMDCVDKIYWEDREKYFIGSGIIKFYEFTSTFQTMFVPAFPDLLELISHSTEANAYDLKKYIQQFNISALNEENAKICRKILSNM